jgi:predicted hydrocarbon binding protein
MTALLRQELGDFISIACFKAVIVGIENALGERATAISLLAAGRARGKKLAEELGLVNSSVPLNEVTARLNQVLGKQGTRLCIVEKVVQDGDVIKVYTTETVCSAGEPQGSSRNSTFTLGAIWGVLEQLLNYRLQGKQTESVLRGGTHDVFEFTPLT